LDSTRRFGDNEARSLSAVICQLMLATQEGSFNDLMKLGKSVAAPNLDAPVTTLSAVSALPTLEPNWYAASRMLS
jgi:hypothetical protein